MAQDLSPEELRELEELEELELLQAEQSNASPSGQPLQKGQTHFVNPETGRTEKLPEEMQPSKEEMIESDPASGVMYGMVEGIPFAKDALSSVEAMTDLAQGSADSFGEAYQANMDQWNKEINLAEENHPAAFIAGDVVSGLALPGTGIKKAMAYGALSMSSREETRDPWRMAIAASEGAALTGALGLGMKGIEKGAGFVAKKLGVLAAETHKEGIGAISGKWKERLNKHIHKTGNADSSDAQKTMEFVKRIGSKNVDGEPLLGTSILKGQSYAVTRDKAHKARGYAGAKLGKVVEQIEEIAPDDIDAKHIYEIAKQRMGIEELRVSDSNSARELAAKYDSYLKSQLLDTVEEIIPQKIKVPSGIVDAQGNPVLTEQIVDSVKKSTQWKKLSPTRLHKMKLHHSKASGKLQSAAQKTQDAMQSKNLTLEEEMSLTLNSAFNDVMDEVNSKVAKKSPELAGAYRAANLEYSDMDMIYKISQSNANQAGEGAISILKRALGVRGLLVAQIQASSGMNGVLAAGVGAAINETIRNPKSASKAGAMLTKVNNVIGNDPNSPYLKRIITAAAVSAYDDNVASNDALRNAIAGSAAEISLMESPIKRTYADIEDKSDFILEALQYHDPKQADQLRSAFDSNDKETIRAIMDQVSKNPDMALMFEDGRGIDGRVFSEEDKQALRDEVESMDISLKQKLQHLDQLNKQGLVPQVEEEPERFLKFEKRDKSKPRY
jgi:hypothetical protein